MGPFETIAKQPGVRALNATASFRRAELNRLSIVTAQKAAHCAVLGISHEAANQAFLAHPESDVARTALIRAEARLSVVQTELITAQRRELEQAALLIQELERAVIS